MKPSEFYEKYWRISDGKGGFVKPPQLSDKEKEFMDNAAHVNADFVNFYRKRRQQVQVNLNYLKEDMQKHPPYFMPINQPKLDKWGNILEEPKQLPE